MNKKYFLINKKGELISMVGLRVLSLCDGMSCGQIALTELGIKFDKYFASEIKDIAIKATNHNFPNTIQIGDVNVYFKQIRVTLKGGDIMLVLIHTTRLKL